MAAHQIGLPVVRIAAGLKVWVGPVERKFAVAGFVNIVDFQRQQAAFLIKKELGIVGSRLEDRLHKLEELLRFVQFRGWQARPHAVEKFGNFFVRHNRAFVNEVAHKRGVQACLHRVEIVLIAHPQRHLPMKGDGRVFGRGAFGLVAVAGVAAASAYGQGGPTLALEQHLKAKARIVKNGLELEGKGRAFDAAGFVCILPQQIIFLAHRPEKPRGKTLRNFNPVAVIIKVLAYLAGNVRQLGRKFAPVGVLDDLLERYLVVHA